MREARGSDFAVPVEGIGVFSFARRTLGDAIKIRAEYRKLIGDTDSEDVELMGTANMVATIKVLAVSAPNGWDKPDQKDMADSPSVLEDLIKIYDALKEKEDSFRGQTARNGEAQGQGASGDAAVLVPEEVQPAAQQPGTA